MKNQKKTSRYLTGLLFCGFLLMQANISFAQGRHGFRGHGVARGHAGFGNVERLASRLDLTDDQVTAMNEERLKSQKQAIQLRADLQVARLELRDMMDDSKPDQNKVKQQVEKMGDLRTTLMLTRVQSHLKMKEVLTEEQRVKLKEMRMEMRRRPDRQKDHPRLRRGRFGMLDEEDLLIPEEEPDVELF